VSFAIDRGECFGFLGPNGSGKTTTIGMLLGIITPTAGSFRLFGGSTPAQLHAARRRIGATLEYPNFYPYLSGRDNLRIVANVKGKGPNEVREVLDIVGLGKREKGVFKTYSLGMKQRLALAATMLGDPELIVLDEPANGLDPEGMREIRKIIKDLADRGTTISLSSHLLWEVERTCTHVAIIKSGRVIRQASVKDITSGNIFAGLKGGDLQRLRAVAAGFPEAISARIEGEMVVLELPDRDLAPVNEYMASNGIRLSYLAPQERSLEDVFMELTGAGESAGMGTVT